MQFPLSTAMSAQLDFVETTGSTNTDLVAAAPTLPDFSVLVAGYQSAGRGRSGRDWQAPEGSSLFVSVLLKPAAGQLEPANFSWLPLMAGLAMANAIGTFIDASSVQVKWPNDVLVNDLKISGVLSELLPDFSGVVIGAGLNVSQTQQQLPIDAATSLSLQGAEDLSLDGILFRYLAGLKSLYEAFVAAKGNAVDSGLRSQVVGRCTSVGRRVRAILPGDKELIGEAIGIDETGRLVISPESGGEAVAIAAGDIVHLRHN
jgi:BirA family biotin operon repressor/biotin-[acetyl-CoA-carboxylase] ligase